MFSLRHPLTGQLLSTTQRSYDTHCGLEVLEGLEMVEVAGTEAGASDQEAIWRVTASRAPELGGILALTGYKDTVCFSGAAGH